MQHAFGKKGGDLKKKVTAMSVHITRKDPTKKKKSGRPSTKQKSEDMVRDMVSAGELVPVEDPDDLEVNRRREQVWRLHLRGVNKEVIAKFFKVSEPTIYRDLKIQNEKMQEGLSTLGAAGVVTQSYYYFEHLRAETMSLLEDVKNKVSDLDVKEGTDYPLLSAVVKDQAMLVRLAKDIESEKMRMLLGIGLIPRRKAPVPMNMEADDSTEMVDFTTDTAREVLGEVLALIRGE